VGSLSYIFVILLRNFTHNLNLGFRSATKTMPCSMPFSFAEFFKDTPWLNTPLERQATFIEPLYPRGGLLGGSSDGAPKMSKLQALAAARRKKAQEQKSSSSTGVEQPMANLTLDSPCKSAEPKAGSSSRGFPQRKRKDSNPHEKIPTPIERESTQSNPDIPMETPPLDQAEPSAFANTMFSNTSQPTSRQHPDSLFTLPYNAAKTTTIADPFAGPSPDDVVMAAQSKGSTISAHPKN
jgi:elongation factor 1 alpha-like protein